MATDDQNIIEFAKELKGKLNSGEFDTVMKEYIRAVKSCQDTSEVSGVTNVVTNAKEVRYELLICIVSLVIAIGFFAEKTHNEAGWVAIGSAVLFFGYDAFKYWKSIK